MLTLSKIGFGKAKFFILLLSVALPLLAPAARPQRFTLASPDGRLVTHIVADQGSLVYDIVYNQSTLLMPSRIGLDYVQGDRTFHSLTVRKTSRRAVDETVAAPFSRQATMRDHYNELTLQLKEGLSLVFRAYDEGIAYRFRWEGPAGRVEQETVQYAFARNWQVTAPYVTSFDSTNHASQYNSSFENLYTHTTLDGLDSRRLCFLPLLVHCDNGVKVCLTESTLLDYPGLYLHGEGRDAILSGEHAPVPKRVEQGGHNNLQLLVRERESYIAQMDQERLFPWRIAMVAPSDAALAMNNLSYLLGEPSRVQDISWIKPGKVAWDWWNNWNIGGVDFKAGVNNDTYQYYIDFAARCGVEYVILDEGWAVNGRADLFQVVPKIDLPLLVRYAEERGVGLILWAGYYAFDRDMERVCRHYSEMGIKGFKIDFMDRDDQVVTDFYRRAAEMCARYHLLADFHGAFKPAGLNRTYPNVLNFEGVAGLEQLKWAPASWNQVQYDTEIPFIRQTAGPMDYTQGAMINAAKGCYFPSWSEPMSQGTRCHQLALYIVLESPLNMMCDSPTNYLKEPECTSLIASLPTVWDETVVLQGEVGEFIVTARRKGNTWYIGGITNWTARDISLDFDSLLGKEGRSGRQMQLYQDGVNAHRKGSDYRHTESAVPSVQTLHLAPGGGFLAIVK